MKYSKTVLLPINVAAGNFCFGNRRCCGHFDNEGGHPTCGLNIDDLKYKEGIVPKPDKCKNLEEK